MGTKIETLITDITTLLTLIKDTDGIKKISDPLVIAGILALIGTDLRQYQSITCGPANPIDTQTRVGGAAIDPRDVSDRWARLLGQVDLARVLGAAMSAANPVVTGVFDGAGNRQPAMDVAARRGYVQLTDGTSNVVTVSITAGGATNVHERVATVHDAKTYSVKIGKINVSTPLNIGALNKIPKVHCYRIQSESDGQRVRFYDVATGAPVSEEWMLNAREGVSSTFVHAPGFLFEGSIAGNDIGVFTANSTFVNFGITYSVDDAS